MNDLGAFASVFDAIAPYDGTPPAGFYADWLGAITDARFRAYTGLRPEEVGGAPVRHRLPRIEDGEGWFESVNQVEAAREARGRFVMVSLGACYGAQAVGSYLALRRLSQMPCKLVAVEPEPVNLSWIAQHFRANGIDPDEHWLIGAAIGATNQPTLFPVGAPGSGAQNCICTNDDAARAAYVGALASSGKRAKAALRGLLLDGSTGIRRNLLTGEETDPVGGPAPSLLLRTMKHRLARYLRGHSGEGHANTAYFESEIKLVSTVTLRDVLAPFDRVDYVEMDIQSSEIAVVPPFMDQLKRKVRRIHIGTHGMAVHQDLAARFREHGWRILFDYPPNSRHTTPAGVFTLNDGVLTVLNDDIGSCATA
jgi:hypothetical protein